MPNHTDNYLRIEADPEHGDAIRAMLFKDRKEQFSYEALVPMPELVCKTQTGFRTFHGQEHRAWVHEDGKDRPLTQVEQAELAAIGATGWHDWAYKNWGVKWDAYTCEVDICENAEIEIEIEVWFQSPWGPPVNWYSTLKAKLAELDSSIAVELHYRLEDDPPYPHSL